MIDVSVRRYRGPASVAHDIAHRYPRCRPLYPLRGPERAAQPRAQRSGIATGRSGAASPPRILSGPPMKANS
ncbi:hypothetical protein [Lysobacter gummosus]|uniref:hypothetical protein n=1 Tax=Lysobacter gummosus TaxID=262324 RepID=UPI003631184A